MQIGKEFGLEEEKLLEFVREQLRLEEEKEEKRRQLEEEKEEKRRLTWMLTYDDLRDS